VEEADRGGDLSRQGRRRAALVSLSTERAGRRGRGDARASGSGDARASGGGGKRSRAWGRRRRRGGAAGVHLERCGGGRLGEGDDGGVEMDLDGGGAGRRARVEGERGVRQEEEERGRRECGRSSG
jgi:hypothetical protein